MIPEDLCDRDCDWPHYCPCEEFEQLRDEEGWGQPQQEFDQNRDVGDENDNIEGMLENCRDQGDGKF